MTVLSNYVILICLMLTIGSSYSQQFNYEVEKRILDRLSYYFHLGGPVRTNDVLNSYLENGGFRHHLRAPDRDSYLTLAYSLEEPLVYYGLEDGLCVGYYWTYGYYREPGNDGYDINDKSMKKHLKSCVNRQTGEPEDCVLNPGSNYIKWIDDGALQPCPIEDELEDDCDINQTSIGEGQQQEVVCSKTTNDNGALDQRQQKWCRQYSIETAEAIIIDDDNNNSSASNTAPTTTGVGYIPLTSYCHDVHGRFTQDLGVISPLDGNMSNGLGNCYFGDGKTLVNRSLVGDYAYCGDGDEKTTCSNTFAGGFQSGSYDPRYRPWYINTKALQRPNWSPPYAFFDYLGIGITYAHPIYSTTKDGRQVFDGVLAVDYRFDDIADFLKETYGNTSTSIVIYEDAEPHYVIGTSTGSAATSLFLASDLTQPCPEDDDTVECTPLRIPIANLSATAIDKTLLHAAEVHERNEYREELFVVRAVNDDDDDENNNDIREGGIYVSQSTLYDHSEANLKWRVVIIQPGQQSTTDEIMPDNADLFPIVCIIGGLGIVFCTLCFMVFYKNRGELAVIFADWRFTCAFIFGCILLNSSTFTLLGPNTDGMCLLRMWSFHLFFVLALSPLFVKTWRMKQLVGQGGIRRVKITNQQAAAYNIPMIFVQVVILTFITIFDPPQQTEVIENINGVIYQHIVCSSTTNALFIIQLVFEAGFILVGCYLAYRTRTMNTKYGESKQLMFAMYNIAFVGIMIVIVVNTAEITPNGSKLLQSIGIFWGTVFSSAVFVIPRMIQVREDMKNERRQRRRGEESNRGTVRVTGIDTTTCIPADTTTSMAIRQSWSHFAPENAESDSEELRPHFAQENTETHNEITETNNDDIRSYFAPENAD